MTHRLHNAVYAAIDAVIASERITKAKLSELSRDLLIYIPETDDIDAVNRLVAGLTPMNRKTAILFFNHFLPFVQEKDKEGNHSRYGKKVTREKTLVKKCKLIAEFLADEFNDIWSWAELNVQVEQKKKDFAGMIKKDIEKALKGDEKTETEALSPAEILNAVFMAGISIEDMLLAAAKLDNGGSGEEHPAADAA